MWQVGVPPPTSPIAPLFWAGGTDLLQCWIQVSFYWSAPCASGKLRWSGHHRFLYPTPHQIQTSINRAHCHNSFCHYIPKTGDKKGSFAQGGNSCLGSNSQKKHQVPSLQKASDNCCSRSSEKTSTCSTKCLEESWYKCERKLGSTRESKRASVVHPSSEMLRAH